MLPLLDDDEPHPLEMHNADAGSDFILICEHAGRLLPRTAGTLGSMSLIKSRMTTMPVHGEARGLPCVEFEIRNDLIGDPKAAGSWADLIARALRFGAAAVP